ncbi:MAG: CrcB family protein [Marmoricola sp.]
MTPRHSGGLSLLAGAAALGGAVGALARWGLTEAFPVPAGHFPWVVLLINVSGSALLAAVPLLPVARRVPWVAVFLGTGILGGYTTMSAASVDTFTLLDTGHPAQALAYSLGTLAAALAAVLLVERWGDAGERARIEREGGDE